MRAIVVANYHPRSAKQEIPMMDNSQDSASIDRVLDVNAIAEILGCSPSHVYRLADAGRMPRPVHIGRLVRWQQFKIKQWIDDGCPKLRAFNSR